MQITPRAVLFAALLASAPLLAAEAGSPTADAPAQHATMAPDDCWPATAELSTGLAGLLPRAGSMPDSAGIDRDPRKAVSCVHPLGLQKDEPGKGGSPRQDHFLTSVPADTSTSWHRQRSFLESSPGPATPGAHF